MQLSVIILNYNVRYYLEQCLLSVEKALQNIDSEVIVIDNASNDTSCNMVKSKFPRVTLIENELNLGFPKGNNRGVKVAKGRYICILNPDTLVAEDTFTKILEHINQIDNSNLGILGCHLIDGSGSFLPESKRGIPTPWVAFTKIFGFYKIFPKNTFFNQYYVQQIPENQNDKVPILVGAFMFLERELYTKLGGFDEQCFMYSDDIDLSYMTLKTGKFNYYFSETSVLHYKGESTVRDATYMNRFSEAMQFFYKKHFNTSLFFSLFMPIGTWLFSNFKRKQHGVKTRKIEAYIVFSRDNLQLKTEIKTSYLTDFELFNHDSKKNIEIIFDTRSFSFKEIITFMKKYKRQGISFKNYIASSNYLIGSNHSNERGEVIVL